MCAMTVTVSPEVKVHRAGKSLVDKVKELPAASEGSNRNVVDHKAVDFQAVFLDILPLIAVSKDTLDPKIGGNVL